MFKISVLCLVAIAVGILASEEDRIVGGQEAEKGQFPFMVSLHSTSLIGSKHFCGGSILNHHLVLTAAHCMSGSHADSQRVQIVVGAHRSTDDGIFHTIKRVVYHPNWVLRIFKNDIAILQAHVSFAFNQLVQPIALPKADTPDENNLALTVIGWGQNLVSSILHK